MGLVGIAAAITDLRERGRIGAQKTRCLVDADAAWDAVSAEERARVGHSAAADGTFFMSLVRRLLNRRTCAH